MRRGRRENKQHRQPRPQRLGGLLSLKDFPLITIKGITTYIKPSWFLFIGLLWALNGFNPLFLPAILIVFSLVVIHEYGHSLFAKMVYNINCKRIYLIPFGGMAIVGKLEPGRRELWITVAGPTTNLVMWLVGQFILLPLMPAEGIATTAVGFITMVNLVLLLFNIIPIFPMDGGRITRSLLFLATRDVVLSTRIAYWGGLGASMAVLLLWRLDLWIVLILTFIAYRGYQELKMVESQHGR